MHFLLVGPGALGCLLSFVVSKGLTAQDQLTILDYNSHRADYLNTHGITYHLDEDKQTVAVRSVSEPTAVPAVDVVFLCVKSYDVLDSLTFCKSLLTDKTLLIFLQNGISHLDLDADFDTSKAAYGTTTEGATLLQTGHVRHAGSGATYLGFLQNPSATHDLLLQKTHKTLSAGGLQVHRTDNIRERLWAKLFINVGINALTAILDCTNGELITLPEASRRMENAVAEAREVALKNGIEVLEDPLPATRSVCAGTARNVSSMLQDVRSKRQTEIDAINGAIVTLGKKLAIDTPENSLLNSQVKKIEAHYHQS